MKKILFILLSIVTINLSAEPAKGAVLNAKIELLEAHPSKENTKMIQPGTPIVIAAALKNNGDETNAEGYFFVRFAYPAPLAKDQKSQLFVTEKVPLPPIAPGKEAFISFNTTQKLPSLNDFIREDYGMRQYEAIVQIDNQDYLVGNATITYSAYYYGGTNDAIEKVVPSLGASK